jgi:hypothetical protein
MSHSDFSSDFIVCRPFSLSKDLPSFVHVVLAFSYPSMSRNAMLMIVNQIKKLKETLKALASTFKYLHDYYCHYHLIAAKAVAALVSGIQEPSPNYQGHHLSAVDYFAIQHPLQY